MGAPIVIPSSDFSFYALTSVLAYLVGFILLVREGYIRKYPLLPWMLVIASAFLFFTMGCRLITFSGEDWSSLLRFENNANTPRSVLGGILLCIPGVWAASRCLGFKYEALDAFAKVGPIGLALQRVGCLLAGCCYGNPTTLPWSVQYDAQSHAYTDHIQLGLVSTDSALSLPVHPVQVYELILCVGIVAVISRLRHQVKAGGTLFLASIALYGTCRFFTEFLRAHGGQWTGEPVFMGLNIVQCVILLIVPLLLLLIYFRERNQAVQTISQGIKPDYYFLLLCAIFFAASRWLDVLDVMAFYIALIPILGWYLVSWISNPRYQVARIALPMCAVVLMSQTTADSTRVNLNESYTTLSLGLLGGHNDLSKTAKDCNNQSSYTSNHDVSYVTGALGVTRSVPVGNQEIFSFGVAGWSGYHSEDVTYSNVSSTASSNGQFPASHTGVTTFGFRPFVQLDTKKIGIGFGYNFGNMVDITSPSTTFNGTTAEVTTIRKFNVLPAVHMRVGNLKALFFEYRYGYQFPSAFPSQRHQFIVGVGGIGKNGSTIRLGTASRSTLFFSPTIPTGDHLTIEPFLGLDLGGYWVDGTASGLMGSVSVNYRFNKKVKK